LLPAKRSAPFVAKALRVLREEIGPRPRIGDRSIVPYFPGYGCIGEHPKLADLAVFVSILLKSTSLSGVCDLGAQQCCSIEAIRFGATRAAVDQETGCLQNTVVDARST
jgi:hypothetical protein